MHKEHSARVPTTVGPFSWFTGKYNSSCVALRSIQRSEEWHTSSVLRDEAAASILEASVKVGGR